MTSMRGRGRGARASPVGSDSFRRGSWRGSPGSAGYSTRGGGNGGSNNSTRDKPDGKDGKDGKGFQTDTDISSGTRNAERELKPWGADEEPSRGNGTAGAGSTAAGLRDALTFGMGTSSVPWDQFETNTRLFGAKTDYDEELYTTKLDRSGTDYKKRERDADRMAAEISSKSSSNPHIAEERGQAVPDNKDEEEKYSGVVRSQGAYVPPGARKGTPNAPRKDSVNKKDGSKESPKESPKPAPKDIPKPNGAPSSTPPVSSTPVPLPVLPTLITAPSSTPPPAAPPLATRLSSDAVMDPAIASLGPTPPTGAPSMARSTSSVPPRQANGAESGSTSATTPLSKAPIGAVIDQARLFVESERERVTQRKQSMVKNERATVLADLKSWQAKFKVPLPIPKDILPILSKDEQKQRDIENKADKLLHEAQDRKKSAAGVSIKSPAAVSTAALSPEPHKTTGPKKIPMKIPEIPPFRKKVPPAVPVPETAAQNITLVTSPTPSNASLHSAAKLNPNASAFVFKPNPSAAAFQPSTSSHQSPASTSAKLSPAQPTAGPGTSPSPSASTSSAPKNAFYRDGPPKRIVVDTRSDFNPFKHGQVPAAASVPLQWAYTGRRSSVAFGGAHAHMMGMQPGSFEGDDPSSPPHGPPPMLQGVPANLLPFYRYQPGMPPGVQQNMMHMFPSGPGYMPQQMGSPHLGQPGPQQGPNGMPMYFANGMPHNAAHFVNPQMLHFHPNGPGRPGPGGPMYYPGGQMPGPHQAPQMQPQMSYSGQPTPPQPHFQQPLPPQGQPGGPPQPYEGSPAQ